MLRYLKGTLDKELCYRKTEEDLSLIAYSDADWATDLSDRRSTTGYCFALSKCGPVICWKTRKQATVALSTCEAEYMAMAATAQESLYLSQLLNGMDSEKQYSPVTIFADNQGAIALSKNPINRQRCKHIDIRYHFIRSALKEKMLKVEYCASADMVADIMPKSVSKGKIERFTSFLFGV